MGQGKAVPIRRASLAIGDVAVSKEAPSGIKSVSFEVPIKAGQHELKTLFYDSGGNELCSAYYTRVVRRP